jgi:hypothetical protein
MLKKKIVDAVNEEKRYHRLKVMNKKIRVGDENYVR